MEMLRYTFGLRTQRLSEFDTNVAACSSIVYASLTDTYASHFFKAYGLST